jgi:prophage antirepressor-like protein
MPNIRTYIFNNTVIRVIIKCKQPWFVKDDILSVLDLRDTEVLNPKECATFTITDTNSTKDIPVISMRAVYRLVYMQQDVNKTNNLVLFLRRVGDAVVGDYRNTSLSRYRHRATSLSRYRRGHWLDLEIILILLVTITMSNLLTPHKHTAISPLNGMLSVDTVEAHNYK